MFEFNNVNTELSQEDWENMDNEVRQELTDYLDSVKFIQLLTAKDRPYAKDMLRRDDGRIIVDMSNPHILEDMDYFRKPAIFFQEHGTYTNLYPNSHPQSAYVKYWKEEAKRCRDGLLRESDGEWITGDFYFYLNYGRIYLTRYKQGSKRADRVEDFPNFYDGDYYYFHYLEDCREEGKNGSVLKSRGKGFSFKEV